MFARTLSHLPSELASPSPLCCTKHSREVGVSDATLRAAATHEVARAWAWCALYSLTFHRRAPASDCSVKTQTCGLAVAAAAQPACTSGTGSHWLQSSVCSPHKWLPPEPCTPVSWSGKGTARVDPIAAATFLSNTLLPLLPPPYRWWSLTSPWDAEIASVALPALCAMLMEPVVGAINSGTFSAALCQQDLVRP